MKKLTFMALAAIIGAAFTACTSTNPKPDLKTDLDTLSYAVGLANSNGLNEYLFERLGIDSVYMNDFLKGLNEGVNAGDNKKKTAYYTGLQIGQQVATQMLPALNSQAFGNDSTQTLSLKNFMAGFVQGAKKGQGLFDMDKAQQYANDKMNTMHKAAVLKQFKDNKEKGEKFLAENAKKEGVKVLESGVQYRVITEGHGVIPADTSIVKVIYEGSTLDGEVFDSNWDKDPRNLRVNQVIKGWSDVLTHMPVGSEWEFYVPQEVAYAEREMGSIKPFSVLKFKLKLVGIEKPQVPLLKR